MGGYLPNRARPGILVQLWRTDNDPNDQIFQVDLVGIRSDVARLLIAGQELEVALISRGEAVSAVCQTLEGNIVGALAAFRGIAKLISNLGRGLRYQAFVVEASATRCEVRVELIS
jgi:hypothetical protein